MMRRLPAGTEPAARGREPHTPPPGRRARPGRGRARLADERGGTVVLVAVALSALLAMAALAVDLGMAFTARTEAQRVADAAALAGASVFLEQYGTAYPDSAVRWAKGYAARNSVRNRTVDTASVASATIGNGFVHDFADGRIEVIPGQYLVRVTVRRAALPTWFARTLGVDEMRVSARAAARVRSASSATCVKPFAVPDLWHDANANERYDAGERYERYDPYNPSATATGYGSSLPGAQYGARVTLVIGDPHSTITPSIALPLEMPKDPAMPKGCRTGGGGGQSEYRSNICNCNNAEFKLGEPGYMLLSSNAAKQGETGHGVRALLDQDPNARWENGTVVGSRYANWLDSPRVIRLAMFDPRQIPDIRSGYQNRLHFNNIALFFVEDPQGKGGINFDGITGRFLGYPAPGYGYDGPTTGSTIKVLQLVE